MRKVLSEKKAKAFDAVRRGLDPKAASAASGVPVSTIRGWIRKGEIPSASAPSLPPTPAPAVLSMNPPGLKIDALTTPASLPQEAGGLRAAMEAIGQPMPKGAEPPAPAPPAAPKLDPAEDARFCLETLKSMKCLVGSVAADLLLKLDTSRPEVAACLDLKPYTVHVVRANATALAEQLRAAGGGESLTLAWCVIGLDAAVSAFMLWALREKNAREPAEESDQPGRN